VPNKHKTATIGWNPGDPTLKPWIEAESGRRGITRKALLDEALSMYREQSAELAEERGPSPHQVSRHG
jgi:hypothetical protein